MAQHSSGSDDGDAALLRRLVVLAQGLVGDADGTRFLNMLLQAVVELTAAATASICVLDGDAPTILASTSPRVTELELTQLEDPAGGPCRECLRLAEAVSMPNLATDPRWPAFTRMARSFGVSEVHVLPLTTTEDLLGALNLFATDEPLARRDHQVADLLGDLATTALLQRASRTRERAEVAHLRLALTSRVAIEQAKGVLSEHAGLDMAAAFEALRRYSRNHRRPLHEVAQRVADRTLSPRTVLAELPR